VKTDVKAQVKLEVDSRLMTEMGSGLAPTAPRHQWGTEPAGGDAGGTERPAGAAGASSVRQALTLGLALALLAFVGLTLSCTHETPGEIVFWQFQPPEIMNQLVSEFQAENPAIKVRLETLTWQSGYEKIVMAFSAEDPPDLLELGSTWFPKFASEGAIQDVTGATGDLAGELVMWDLASYGGRRFGLPWLIGSRVLFYNKRLFAENGLSPEGPPETWSDLLAAARAIHDPAAGVYGFGMNAGERYVLFKKFMPFAWGNGGTVLNDDLTASRMDSRENLEALEFYLSLKPYSILERQDMIDEMFKQGKIGLMISGGWNLKRIPEDAPGLDFGVALMPRPDRGGTHSSFAGAEILVFPKGDHLDAAMQLARFLVSSPQALRIASQVKSVQPASRQALLDPYYAEHPMEKLLLEQCEMALSPPPSPHWQEIEEVINDRLEECLYGKLMPAEALALIDQRVNLILTKPRP
jgi:multiple sugar transport system substrate-binding protein